MITYSIQISEKLTLQVDPFPVLGNDQLLKLFPGSKISYIVTGKQCMIYTVEMGCDNDSIRRFPADLPDIIQIHDEPSERYRGFAAIQNDDLRSKSFDRIFDSFTINSIREQVERGDGEKMLPFSFMGWVECIADTAWDWQFSGLLNNVHTSKNGDFSQAESLSSWNMRYFRDTQVEGDVGYDMRLFFCLGEGVEWKTDKGMIRMDPGEAYFCMDDNRHESMCYSKNSQFMFYSISMPRDKFSSILGFYSINMAGLFSDHNSVHFRISPEVCNLLDHFKLLEYAEDGIDMMRFDALSY